MTITITTASNSSFDRDSRLELRANDSDEVAVRFVKSFAFRKAYTGFQHLCESLAKPAYLVADNFARIQDVQLSRILQNSKVCSRPPLIRSKSLLDITGCAREGQAREDSRQGNDRDHDVDCSLAL